MYTNLLNDIYLKSNGLFCHSEEFDEAIEKLKWGKILYTISPEQDSTIYIFHDIPISELIKPRAEYIDEVTNFIDEYRKFEINNQVHNNHLVLCKTYQNK